MPIAFSRFPTVFAPFFTVFPAHPIRESFGKSGVAPFSGRSDAV